MPSSVRREENLAVREKDLAVAVDLGGTNTACAIADRGCRLLEKTVNSSQAGLESEEVIAHLEGNIRDVIQRSGLDPGRLAAIGVGAPGIVYADPGVVHRAANFPHWRDVPLAQILGEKFSLPAFVRHDVDMAVLAEKHYGEGRDLDHVVCLTIGTGIGIGMILNGRLYCGARAGAGNLGHLIVADEGGERGYLESLAAGPAIRRKAVEALRRGERTALRRLCRGEEERIDARMVFAAARGGDAVGLRIVRQAARLLGEGIAGVINLLAPEIVIVSGSIAQAGKVLFDPLVEAVQACVCPFLRDEVRVVPGRLGDEAGLIGAAHAVWQEIGVRPTPPGPGR